jgi:hypothetical protein
MIMFWAIYAATSICTIGALVAIIVLDREPSKPQNASVKPSEDPPGNLTPTNPDRPRLEFLNRLGAWSPVPPIRPKHAFGAWPARLKSTVP